MDFIKGELLLVNKPLYWTSFDVVKKIRIAIEIKYKLKKLKVGHAGTLDPLATGLMIVCTGGLTKEIIKYQDYDKEYIATIKLGATTPSFDLETEIDKKYDISHINENLINEALKEFTGEILQSPPGYSAKFIKGVRAYNYARKGEKVSLEPNKVHIKEVNMLNFNPPELKIRVICSKGTYIRALARDIGFKLNSGAHLTGLVRTAIGQYKLDNALSVKDFESHLNFM